MEEKIEIRDIRQPGWFFVDNEIIDIYGKELGVYGIAVYAILSRHASQDSQKAWPSIRTMAKTLNTGDKQIQKALKKLKKLDLIHISRDNRHNTYTLLNIKKNVVTETTIPETEGGNVVRETTICSQRDYNDVVTETTEQNIYNNTKEQQQGGVVVSSFSSVKREEAYSQLFLYGIKEETIEDLLEAYPPERIISVCSAASLQPNIKSKAAWIVSALKRGWQVKDRTMREHEKLEAKMRACRRSRGDYCLDPIWLKQQQAHCKLCSLYEYDPKEQFS